MHLYSTSDNAYSRPYKFAIIFIIFFFLCVEFFINLCRICRMFIVEDSVFFCWLHSWAHLTSFAPEDKNCIIVVDPDFFLSRIWIFFIIWIRILTWLSPRFDKHLSKNKTKSVVSCVYYRLNECPISLVHFYIVFYKNWTRTSGHSAWNRFVEENTHIILIDNL